MKRYPQQHLIVGALVALTLMASAAPGWAQPERASTASPDGPAQLEAAPEPEPEPEPEASPWSQGVSAADQERAIALYTEGNLALDEALWLPASRHYRNALRHWDHPGIHYNLAIALLNLDQPIAAYEHIVAALRYGTGALEPDQQEQAQMYRLLLRRQVAEVQVTCPVEGAVVTLDGKPLLTGPGQTTRLISPGAHQLVARKSGHADAVETITASPDGVTAVDMRPIAPVDLPRVRRWLYWQPWVVVGAGALVGVTGLGFQAGASERYARANNLLEKTCPGGCYPGQYPPAVDDLERQGKTRMTLAWTAYLLGATVIAGGATLVYINRPRVVSAESLDANRPRITRAVTPVFTPIVTRDTRGLAARVRF